MKFLIQYYSLLVSFLFFFNSFSQNQNIKGYKIRGETVIFTFNVNDYPNIKHNGDTVDEVFVAGEFNDWAQDRWKMKKVSDSIYELRKELSDFTDDFDWEFKFIINSEHWAEPSRNFENITDAKDKYGNRLMAYNLKMYTAFTSKYGNVTLKLPGYKDANQVVVSGSFNRWDEKSFKMQPTEDGWEVTLQLRPDVYQYKFIVDNHHWITDPQNPSKIENEFGGYNSVIDVQKLVTFELYGYDDAEKVLLSGDFNNWSEEGFVMKADSGIWQYTVRLSRGKYHYKFIVDDQWITDPLNSVVEYDKKGHVNSVCMVK